MKRPTPMVTCRCPGCRRLTRLASGLCQTHHRTALAEGLLMPGRMVPVYSADLMHIKMISRLPRTLASVARLVARANRLAARCGRLKAELAAAEKRLAEIEGGGH